MRSRGQSGITGDRAPAKGAAPRGPVLVVCLARRFGGVDVRVLQTARGLQQRGLPYLVVVLQGSHLQHLLEQENLNVHALNRRRGDPRIVLDLVRLAKANRSVLIDTHNMQSQYWAALAAIFGRIPGRVATVHSVYRETYPGYSEDNPRFFRRHMHEGSLRLCRFAGFRFIVVSREVLDYLQDFLKLPPAAITLSWNGLEPLDHSPRAIDLRALAGWPADSIVLGIIARLEGVKGHRPLLEALRNLVAAGENRARLIVVGEGREQDNLKTIVRDFGLQEHVHIAGFRKDVPEILAGLDLVCQPSNSEGLPYTILEACRQGIPVLSSDLPGISTLFKDNETMFFTAAGDVEKLGRRLREILDDPAGRLRVGAAAKRFVESDIGVEHMIETTMNVYAQASGGVTTT